jgi:hypothetical protein
MQRLVARLLVVLLSMLGLVALTATPSSAQDELLLTVSVDQATVDPTTGLVTISGTVTCSEPSIVTIAGTITQQDTTGYFMTRLTCPGPEGATFTAGSLAFDGRFHPGPAHLSLYVAGCVLGPELTCVRQATLQTETTLRLHPAA